MPIALYAGARAGDCSHTPIGKKLGSFGNPPGYSSWAEVAVPVNSSAERAASQIGKKYRIYLQLVHGRGTRLPSSSLTVA
jgi:hypothetical protein